MKKIFSITLIIISLFYIGNLFAEAVSINQAENVAKNWYLERCKGDSIPQFDIVETFTETKDSEVVYYIFNFTPSGFVIVSADDISFPILGYSESNSYGTTNHPPAFDELLEYYALQIDSARTEGIDPSQETIELWQRLNVNPEDFVPERTSRNVEPLLTTEWHQGQYYNEMCPYDASSSTGNNHVWAGCVATAMAQVMKYWNYPTTGTGSHSYTHPEYGTLSANFGSTTYDWSAMPDNVTSSNTAVQTLLYHCGVGVEMDYGPDSGAYIGECSPSALTALESYFKYAPIAHFELKEDYSNSLWNGMIRNELNNGRPLIYRGQGTNGHAFNLDGYEGANYFHFNWGWSGYYNGYYYLNNLNPGGNNYTDSQGAIFWIAPSTITIVQGTISLSGGNGNLNNSKVTFRKLENDILTDEFSDVTNNNGEYEVHVSSNCHYKITFEHLSGNYENQALQEIYVPTQGVVNLDTVTLNYNPDKIIVVPDDYSDIQLALNRIQHAGTVYIMDGTYDGENNRNLSWSNKHITVRSFSGPDNCIIDCEESGRGFNLIDSNINNDDLIYGLTICNGFVNQDENGAGIRCTNGSSPTIQDCIIKDNYSDNYAGDDHDNLGVGIYCEDSTIVKNCVIKDNYGMDIEGGAGIACKGDVTIENCLFSGNYLSFWSGIDNPDANRFGHAIYVFDSSDLGNPQIINNEFYENYGVDSFQGYGVILVESDSYPGNFNDPIDLSGNYFHDEDHYYSPEYMLILPDEYKYIITNNIFENCNPIHNSHAAGMISNDYTFENNTLINTQIEFSDCDDMELVNSIFMDYTTGAVIYWDYDDTESMEVSHCLFYNNDTNYNHANEVETNSIIDGEDPLLSSSFIPIWNQDDISPCIDAGDPDMTWDPDDTPPDMGAITAVTHSYFNNQYDDNEVLDNAEWISFPALNRTTANYTEALGLLHRQELIDTVTNNYQAAILDHILYEDDNDPKIYYDDEFNTWENELPPDGNFHSYQGYKIQLQEEVLSTSIGITGRWNNESDPINLYASKDNWIGCYLEEPATFRDAFSSIWDEWESVYSEHWAVARPEPGLIPTAVDTLTANPGELYIITVFEDCQLIWNKSSPSPPPRTKEMTDYFTYDKKLDYMPVNIDTVYGDMPQEIAVYEGDECLGASKVNGSYPVQILAYPPDGTKNGNIDFMLYYGSKVKAKAVTDYRVYEHKVSAYVNRDLAFDKEAYVTVRLNTKEAEPEFSFGLFNNYSNPVNSDLTHISFAPASEAKNTAIKIYNVRGQLVRELDCSNAGYNKAGIPTVSWDCKDSRGRKIQNGVYFYKLMSDKKLAVKKMVIVK